MPDIAQLDPPLKALFDQLAAGSEGAGGVETMSPTEARAMYSMLALMDGEPDAVASVSDREVAGVPCRVYEPEGAVGTLAWFHGGGWVIGDLDTAHTTASRLAARATCRVVSVDYRLAPEHPHPAALDDCWAVTQALQAEPGSGPLAVGGDSAGGNLAAVVALLARDGGVPLVHQLLVYPVTDAANESDSYIENGEGFLLTAATMRWFIDCYASEAQRADWRVSPLLAPSLEGVAGAHVITAAFDPLRDEGDAYAECLAAAGVPVEHDRVGNVTHGFIALGGITQETNAAIDRAAGMLARAMR